MVAVLPSNASPPMTLAEAKSELHRLLEEQARRKEHETWANFFPDTGPYRRELYHKHCQFMAASATHRESIAFGGNRSGKSLMGAFVCALHLTGEYPDWWEGRRFDKPTRGVACGKEGKIVRDSIQKLLMGEAGKFGTGMIPARCLDRSRVSASRGASGLYDRIMVKHVSGGWSTLRLKSYDQGREAFESVELEFVWEDEEAPMDIHSENLMRTMTTNGIVMNTFTPLKGTTPLVRDLIKRAKEGSVFSIEIPWDDAPHITTEMIDDMMKRYPSHEIAARRYGKPQLGSGAIFTLDPRELVVPPRELPDHWPRLYGLDFGWTHPTAAIWGAWDRDADVLYLYSEHRRSQTEMSTHAAAIHARGRWMRGMSETAGTNISDGRKIYDIYKRDHLLKLKAADKSVEAGIMKWQQRMATGGLKVFDTCTGWLSEYLTYHRVKGIICKEEDDLMDATRYLIMGLEKYAKTKVEMTGHLIGNNVTELTFGNWRQ
jgi:phage terminase large subunit-like protein